MKFITGEPAVKIGKYLVVADLHLGIETEYWRAGFRISSHIMEMAKRLNRIAMEAKAREIVVNGDFKNSIAFPSRREERYIPEFLDALSFPLTVVRGNHDGGIERFADAIPEMRIGAWTVTHGHRNSGGKRLVIGHNHPVVEIRDAMGSVYQEKVWVFGRKESGGGRKRIIVMPAFSDLVGGHPVPDFQGIAKGMEVERVVMLDGLEISGEWKGKGPEE